MKLRVLLPRVGTLIHLNCVQICLDLKAFYSASWNIILICKRYRRFVELSWPSVTFDRFIYKELNIWPWESVLVSLPNSLKHLFFLSAFRYWFLYDVYSAFLKAMTTQIFGEMKMIMLHVGLSQMKIPASGFQLRLRLSLKDLVQLQSQS